MNKQELVANIAEKAGLSKADAKRALDAILEGVEKSLSRGEKVTLVGFGTFQVLKRAARKGRNPRTGEIISIASGKIPSLSPGKALKEAVKRKGTDDPGPSIDRK